MELYEDINRLIGTSYKSDKTINFGSISSNKSLSEEFIEKYKEYLDWHSISSRQILSEDFIEKYKDYVDWELVSCFQHLSEDFIEKHIDLLTFEFISHHQKLSEDFMERNSEYIDWPCISMTQRLSEDFIERHLEKINWYNICRYQKISDAFLTKYKEFCYFQIRNENWMYKPTEFKKNAIKSLKTFRCYDDYFIAYKAIRKSRYSIYNFQYKYDKGGIYESWCDCSSNECAFGLNVCDSKKAHFYGKLMTGPNFIVIKCKVRYEDVGYVNNDAKVVRCLKLEVMN